MRLRKGLRSFNPNFDFILFNVTPRTSIFSGLTTLYDIQSVYRSTSIYVYASIQKIMNNVVVCCVVDRTEQMTEASG